MWLLFPLSLSVFNVNVWGTLEVGPGLVVAGPIEFIGVVNGGVGVGGALEAGPGCVVVVPTEFISVVRWATCLLVTLVHAFCV